MRRVSRRCCRVYSHSEQHVEIPAVSPVTTACSTTRGQLLGQGLRLEFQTVTDFGGIEQAGAVSRDGRFIAFLSDRDGQMDVWVTQVGAGQFYNLTRGRVPELVNPSVRMLGFSPDGALVTFWARGADRANAPTSTSGQCPRLGTSHGRT